MTVLPIVAACAALLIVAYRVYGRLLERWLGVDATRPTPAVINADGNDYVPAPPGVVLGGHFTAIAAAGPIAGPILAGQDFGWLPALLWIMFGAIFIGGVHDAGSLLASMRHGAVSITQVVRRHMSPLAYATFLAFVWISLVYVIIAFADVTADTFSRFKSVEVTRAGVTTTYSVNGGAVVLGATAYLLLSVAMGFAMRFTRIGWPVLLTVCVALLGITIWRSPVWADWLASHGLSFLDTRPIAGATSEQTVVAAGALQKRWDQTLLVYCFIASIVPLWSLLQPRGVIGATFLYAALLFGVLGTFVGGWVGGGLSVDMGRMFLGFEGVKTGGWLFPFLFITIACGACSGFHSIVASGTTCKQVRREGDVKPVAYGAMLLEAMVAVFALCCVMIATGAKTKGADETYAAGMASFMQVVGVPFEFGLMFGLLAFSSFVFDTMDVCTRLGRYVLQEMLGLRGLAGGAVATLLTLSAPAAYLWLMPPNSFRTFWVIFGTSNQLLAALTLVGVSMWLWRTGRPVWFALLPAGFMVLSTGTALVLNFRGFLSSYQQNGQTVALVNMGVAAVLFGLGGLVVAEGVRVWRSSRGLPTVSDPDPRSSATVRV